MLQINERIHIIYVTCWRFYATSWYCHSIYNSVTYGHVFLHYVLFLIGKLSQGILQTQLQVSNFCLILIARRSWIHSGMTPGTVVIQSQKLLGETLFIRRDRTATSINVNRWHFFSKTRVAASSSRKVIACCDVIVCVHENDATSPTEVERRIRITIAIQTIAFC